MTMYGMGRVEFRRGLTINVRIRQIILILLCSFSSVYGTPVKFYSVNSLYGISMRTVNSICKDANGFIWASSKTGILRLTENDCHTYSLPYESADNITVKLTCKNLQLIAFTNNGQIFSYNPVKDRFDLIVNIGEILNTKLLSVNELLIDGDGAFWIALSYGLYRYQSGNLELIEEKSMERYSMTWLDEENLIIAGSSGIRKLNSHSLKTESLYENKTLSPFQVSSLFPDRLRKKLWIGTISNGLCQLDLNSRSFSRILGSTFPRQPILAIEENSDSTLLVGVDGQGIWELDKSGDRILNVYKENADNPFSLKGNGVYDLFCDQDRRVWIGTISGGVSFFDQSVPLIQQIVHQTNNANSLVNDEVNCLIEDQWGKLWFATNNGISCRDVSADRWTHFYSNKLEQAQVFLTLCEDDQGRIWAGSYSSGVYVLDAKTGKELAHYAQGESGFPLVSNFIFDIYKDTQGDIWIGGVNGEFLCYYPEENKFRTYTKEPISLFAEISPGHLLLGCSYGLTLLEKETGELRKILVGYLVQDLLILDREIWVCTNGDGLLKCDHNGNILERFNTHSGLPSDFINSIEYADSVFWVGTETGLCRLDPRDKSVITYTSVLPLSNTSFNRGSHCKLRNGQLAWGTNNGALLFAPELIRELPSEGRIFFQDLTISGRSIREIPSFKLNKPVDSLVSIHLNYTQNTLNLELIPLGNLSGAKFSWKLEEFDKNWSTPAVNRMVSYTNLPSGNFLLKLKMYDSSLNQVITERSLAVQVIPPFWRKTWFIGLLVIALLGILFLYILYYINKLKQKHTEEKVRFFTNTAHEIRTSLTLIKGPVEELSRETDLSVSGRYFLKLAIDQARQLASVVTQLMDFQKLDVGKEQISLSSVDVVKMISNRCAMFESLAKSRNIEIQFTSDRQSYLTAVDEQKMEKVIDNLISNAVKYSHTGSQVLLDLKCDPKKWTIQVKDQGIGISKKAQRLLCKEFYRGDNAVNSKVIGSGIGLLLVKNYVTMHGGTISCVSQENEGSTFQVVVPYREFSPGVNMPERQPEGDLHFTPLLPDAGKMPVHKERHSAGEMKVLIVEDNKDLLHFLQNTLGREFQVHTAEDGEKAWEYLSKHLPDLVISDVMMPNMDGFELCRKVKSTWETSHVPIILLTALSERTEQLHGLGLGADDYLTKPFDIGLLEQRIKSVIRNREVVRAKALKMIRAGSEEPLLANQLNDKFLKRIVEAVRENISDPAFGKEEFAFAVNVSSSLLYKKVKSLTGQSPTDFIKSIRLDHAMDLLKSRQNSVTEVSERCGFSSVGYFSTVFRKQFGKSPSEIAG